MLSIHLTPRATSDRIDGTASQPNGPVIRARVRAVPQDGKANAALEALIADWLSVAKRSVQVTGGHSSRLKSVTITGGGDAILKRLTDLLASE